MIDPPKLLVVPYDLDPGGLIIIDRLRVGWCWDDERAWNIYFYYLITLCFFLCFDIFYDVGERNNEFKFAHAFFTLGRKLQISHWLYRFAIIQRVQLYVLIFFKRRETEKWVKILTSIFTFGKVQISHWLYQFAIIQRVQLYVLIFFKRQGTEEWVKIWTRIFTFGKVQISPWLYQFAII